MTREKTMDYKTLIDNNKNGLKKFGKGLIKNYQEQQLKAVIKFLIRQ